MATVADFSSSLPMRPSAAAASVPRGETLAKIEVHRDIAAVLPAWAELEAVAAASAYQTRAFLLPWIEILAARREIAPFFILATDRQKRHLALLGLGVKHYGPLRIAAFLGGKESNFNLGLFRPDVALSRTELLCLFRTAARLLGPAAPHLFVLQNQPYEWEGSANPLAQLPHQASPSFAYATQLAADADTFFAAKLSKDTRKKLRKKEARLAARGTLALISNNEPATAGLILEAFFTEKIARFEARAIETDFADQSQRAFLERLSLPNGKAQPWLEFYALKMGERIVATYAGAAHRGRFSCLVNSFDMDAEIAKSSPGDLLLMRLITRQCEKGLESFDLGIGEARYKSTYCDTTVRLFDTVLPIGAIGFLCAAIARWQLAIKRAVKHNPKLFAAALRLRRLV